MYYALIISSPVLCSCMIQVNAVELIDQLEVGRRGPYMVIGLALRTIIFMNGSHYDTMYAYTGASKCQEWVAHLQSQARIVNDSDPNERQIECENKVPH